LGEGGIKIRIEFIRLATTAGAPTARPIQLRSDPTHVAALLVDFLMADVSNGEPQQATLSVTVNAEGNGVLVTAAAGAVDETGLQRMASELKATLSLTLGLAAYFDANYTRDEKLRSVRGWS